MHGKGDCGTGVVSLSRLTEVPAAMVTEFSRAGELRIAWRYLVDLSDLY